MSEPKFFLDGDRITIEHHGGRVTLDAGHLSLAIEKLTKAKAQIFGEVDSFSGESGECDSRVGQLGIPRGSVMTSAEDMFRYFSRELTTLPWHISEQFKGLVRFKLINEGAMPSRRHLGLFMWPHLKDLGDSRLDNDTREFTKNYQIMQASGLGYYKKTKGKRGAGTFHIRDAVWGVAVRRSVVVPEMIEQEELV